MIHVLLTEKESSGGSFLKDLLEESDKLDIVAVSHNSIEILYALIQNPVDLMIIDKSLKNINGSDCAGMISKLNIDVKIILLLENEQELASVQNLDMFTGYILKTDSPKKLVATIEQTMNNRPRNYTVDKGELARQAMFN